MCFQPSRPAPILMNPETFMPRWWRGRSTWPSVAACGPRSFDHLVSAGDEHRRHLKAERLGGLEVDHQVKLGRLLDRQF